MDVQTDIEDVEHLGRTKQPRGSSDVLTVNNKDLAPLMARAASVVPRNSALPVLGHVLLKSGRGQLTIDANNMEMAIRQSCAADGPDKQVCVEASSLNAILRQLPGNAEIRMEFGDRHATLRSGTLRAKLATLPIEDYPLFRDLTYAATIEIAGADLAQAFNRTRPFVSANESRYYLQGVHFRPRDNEMRLEASDGKCVGMSTLPRSSAIPPMIVPAKAVDEILRIIGDAPVQIRTSVVAMEIQTGGITFITKLIDATYPDLDRVVAQHAGDASVRVWRVNRTGMLKAVAMASAVGTAGSIVDFHLAEGGCGIKVQERDDEITVDLDDTACSFVGEPCEFRIRLNELVLIVKAAGDVCEFRPNADLSWFRINDVNDPRAAFVVGTYR